MNLKALPESGNDYYGGPVRLAGMVCFDTLAAEPKDDKKPATLTFDLSGLNAVRLTASVGGDFPAGQEENLRKVTSVRTVGKEAKFLTVLEPHEGTPRVKSARALDENTVEVTLVDGTIDRLKINNFYSTQAKPSVELHRNGKLLEKTE